MDKTYIIIDTNAWLYMCNGQGFKNEDLKADAHIKIFEALKKLTDEGKIVVLINDLIISEWNRNYNVTQNYIKKLESQITINNNYLKNDHSQEEKDTKKEEINEITIRINKNKEHTSAVENYLLNHTKNYNITDRSKIISADHAIAKKAPFTGRKSNSMADMVILLSGIEYLKDECQIKLSDKWYFNEKSYFVSANTSDFSKVDDKDIIHDDIKPFLQQTETQYRCNLGILINELSDHIMIDNDDVSDFEEYASYDGDYETCPFCDSDDYGFVEFDDEKVFARNLNYPIYDPNQLQFDFGFDNIPIEILNRNTYAEISEGCCCGCGKTYIRCINCGELIEKEYDNLFQCNRCETDYLIEVTRDKKNIIIDVKYIIPKCENIE